MDPSYDWVVKLAHRWEDYHLERFAVTYGYYITRYPCFNKTKLKQRLREYPCTNEELEHIRHLKSSSYLIPNILLILIFLWTITTTSIVMTLMAGYDLTKPESIYTMLDDRLSQRGCIRTNCSRLMSTKKDGLGKDWLQIPLAGLCWPVARIFMGPLVDLNERGLYTMTYLNFVCFGLYLAINFMQILNPIFDETILFMLCPKWTWDIMSKKMTENLRKLKISMINFSQNSDILDMEQNEREMMQESINRRKYYIRPKEQDKIITASFDSEWQITEDSLLLNEWSTKSKWSVRQEYEWIMRCEYSNLHISNELNKYLEDCRPIVRSDEWRTKVSFLFYMMLTFHMVSQILIYLCISTWWLYYLTERQYGFLRDIDGHMKTQTCSIWFDPDAHSWIYYTSFYKRYILPRIPVPNWVTDIDDLSYVDLGKYKISFEIFPVLIYAMILFVPFISGLVAIASVISCQNELVSWLNELRYQFRFANEYSKMHRFLKLDQTNCKLVHFDLSSLRDQQSEFYKMSFIMYDEIGDTPRFTPSVSINKMLDIQMRCLEIHNYYGYNNSLVDLLEKLHVKTTSFIGSIDSYGKNVLCCVFYNGITNYVNCLVIVYISRHMPFFILPYGLGISVIMGCCTAIIMLAKFNSKSKMIVKDMWSIIACIADAKDPHTQHMHQVWLRMAKTLSDNGFAVKVLDFPLTYVTVTEIFILTLTIFALFMKMDEKNAIRDIVGFIMG